MSGLGTSLRFAVSGVGDLNKALGESETLMKRVTGIKREWDLMRIGFEGVATAARDTAVSTVALGAATAGAVGTQRVAATAVASLWGQARVALIAIAPLLASIAVQMAAASGAAAELARRLDIADAARDLRVTTLQYQALSDALRQVSVDGVTARDILERVAQVSRPTVDLATGDTRVGSAERRLSQMYEASPMNVGGGLVEFRGARDDQERLDAILTAIREVRRAYGELQAEALAMELLPPDLARQAQGNLDMLDKLQASMRDLRANGLDRALLIDEATLRKLQEARDAITETATRIGVNMLPLIRDVAALLYTLGSPVITFTQGLLGVLEVLTSIYNRVREIVVAMGGVTRRTPLTSAEQAEAWGDEMTRQRLTQMDVEILRQGQMGPEGRARAAELAAERARIQAGLEERRERRSRDPVTQGEMDTSAATPTADPRGPAAGRMPIPARGGGGGRDDYDYEGELLRPTRQRTRMTQVDIDMFGRGERAISRMRVEQEMLNRAQEWNLDLTDDLRGKIAVAANTFAETEDRLRQLRLAQEDYNGAVRAAGGAVSSFFSDIVSGGKNAEQAMMNLLKRLGDVFLQAALLGDGPFAGLMGTRGQNGAPGGFIGGLAGLFAPAFGAAPAAGGGGGFLAGIGDFFKSLFTFADGGIMTASGPLPLRAYSSGGVANSPQLALFGEGRDAEAYVPLPDGRSIPVTMTGGGGVSQTVNVGISVTVPAGYQPDEGRRFAEDMRPTLVGLVRGEIANMIRPGGALAGAMS